MRIAVIGNGLTSLILLKCLLKKGINIDFYVEKKERKISTLRTVGITEDNFSYLKKIFPKIHVKSNPVKKILIFRNNDLKNPILTFEKKNENQFNLFNYIDIYKHINKTLKKNKKVKIIKLKSLKSLAVEKIAKNYELIIDTDLQNKFSLKFFWNKIKKNYFSTAYVFKIIHSNIKNDTATQIFTKNGPLAFLPLSPTETSIVFSYKNRLNKILDNSEIIKIFKNLNTKYLIKEISVIEKFKLKQELQKIYFKDNVLAFGDKLHTIHPLAGQGLNMNIRDIKNLMNLIDNKVHIGLPLNEDIAKEFQNNNRYKNIIFANGIDLLLEIFEYEKKLPKIVSKNFFSILEKIKIFKKYSSVIADKGINF